MENKITPPQKKLTRKRFIPVIILISIGIILIFFKDSTKNTVCAVITVLQTSYRASIINLLGASIGVLHFYYIGRLNDKITSDVIRLVSGLFSSIATAIGYAYMMNSGLNFAIGIVDDLFLSNPFFIHPDQIDYVAISLVTLFIIGISGYLLWKLAEDFLFEIVQQSSTAEGVKNPEERNDTIR
jgi:hypothetical protein